MNLGMGIGFFARGSEDLDLSLLDGGLIVTTIFSTLLPKFVPHLKRLGIVLNTWYDGWRGFKFQMERITPHA